MPHLAQGKNMAPQDPSAGMAVYRPRRYVNHSVSAPDELGFFETTRIRRKYDGTSITCNDGELGIGFSRCVKNTSILVNGHCFVECISYDLLGNDKPHIRGLRLGTGISLVVECAALLHK